MLIENFKQAIGTGADQFITIAAGQTTSTILQTLGMQPGALYFPSNWTMANITFYVGRGDQPLNMYLVENYDGTDYVVAKAAGAQAYLPLPPVYFHQVTSIQIVSSVAQDATVQIYVGCTPIYQGIHG